MASNEQMPILDLTVQALSAITVIKHRIPYCKFTAESKVWDGCGFIALLNKYYAHCSYSCAWMVFFHFARAGLALPSQQQLSPLAACSS